jgi:hypothetical protein
MNIDDRRFSDLNRGFAPHAPGAWQHDPAHRLGVPYRDAASRARYQGAVSADTRRAARGYSPTIVPSPERSRAALSSVRPELSPTNRVVSPVEQRSVSAPRSSPAVQRSFVAAPRERTAPPVYESFSPRTEMRAQSSRGFTSRASSPSVSSSHTGSGGGNRGGNNERR